MFRTTASQRALVQRALLRRAPSRPKPNTSLSVSPLTIANVISTYSLRPLLCRERVELTGSLDNGRHNVAIWLNWIVLFDLNQESPLRVKRCPAARPRNVCLHAI